MLNMIFKNPELAAKKLGCSKGGIYGWLNGHTPTLSMMMKVYETYEIHISLGYMYDFFTLIKQLQKKHDLNDMLEYIKISGITKNDKAFLSEYFKKKYWREQNNGK